MAAGVVQLTLRSSQGAVGWKEQLMSNRNAYSIATVESHSNVRHPARDHVFHRLIMATVWFVASFGIAAHVDAAKVDCKPDLEITNGKAKAVKVLSLVYTDSGGNEFNEGLDNKKLSPGETEQWKSVKLQHVYEDNAITKIRIEYRNDTSGEKKPSDPWGPAVKTIWFDQSGVCKDSRTYKITIP